MSEQPKHDSVAPLRLALGMIFCAVAFYIFLAPHGVRETGPYTPEVLPFFYYPVMGGLLGLAIEAASRLSGANFGKATRYIAWGAVLVITVDWHRVSEARTAYGPNYAAQPVPPWQFFYLFIAVLLGFAIEAASRLRGANFGKTTRYIVWGALLVITVDWHRVSEVLIPYGPKNYAAQPVPPWQFFYLFMGGLLGLAIEAAGRLRGANFGKTTRSIMWWAVVGIMVAAIAIECISEARAVPQWKNGGEIVQILVLEDFLRKLIVLPAAAIVGGGVGFLIRRHQARCDGISEPMTDNPGEPRSSRVVAWLFGVLCGIVCGIVGSVLGGYVAPSIEDQEFPKIWAEWVDFFPPVMTAAGILFGGSFGWLFGWLLTALLRGKHLRTGGDHIVIWVFGLLPISVVIALIVSSGCSYRPNAWPPRGPYLTNELLRFLFNHAAWLIIALMAYPLSSGPAYYFARKHMSFFRAVETVYAPLFWVTGHYSPLRNARCRYMELWVDRR